MIKVQGTIGNLTAGVLLGAVLMAARGWASPQTMPATTPGAPATSAATQSTPAASPVPALPAPRGVSIVVINMQRAFDQLDEKKDAEEAMNAKFKPQVADVNAQGTKLSAMKDALEKMPDGAEKQRQQADFELQQAQFNALRQKVAQELQLEQVALVRRIYNRLLDEVEELRVRGGYDIVLLDDPLTPGGDSNLQGVQMQIQLHKVLAKDRRLDVTAQFVALANEAYAATKGAGRP